MGVGESRRNIPYLTTNVTSRLCAIEGGAFAFSVDLFLFCERF
jgi:hypothetical protein